MVGMIAAAPRRLSLPLVTWFGLRARVTAGGDGWHVAQVAGLRLKHPGLVNMVLRTVDPVRPTDP